MENQPIKVLQIIRHMNVGGAETFIMNLYRNIDRQKVQFDFLVYGPGVFDEEIKALGGRIYYMDYITKIGQTKYKKRLSKFFKEHNEYQIVHSHIDQVTGIILETANKCGVKERIAHSHNTRNSNNLLAKLYKKYLQSKINKNATLLLACGEEAAKWLYKKRSKEAIIINNGIDIKKFEYSPKKREKIRDELGANEETVIIGHVGRFSKQKNHKFLIEIYREYVKKNPNSLLIMVGIGILKDEIEKLVEKYDLKENTKCLGLRQDVDAIYSASDYIVFPSLYEGLSVALIEAQISGIKILASDTIDKNTDISRNIQWISLQDSPLKWSESILNMDQTRNNKYLETKKYDIKRIAEKMQDLYENLGEKYD